MGGGPHPWEINVVILLLFMLGTYFFFMDATFIAAIHSMNSFPDEPRPTPTNVGPTFHPFGDITVKKIMLDPVCQYIHKPLMTELVVATDFPSRFPKITPNVVTITHATLALLSTKFFISDNFRSRQIGVLIFEIRNLLDNFDGVLARAIRHTTVLNDYSSSGYYFDGIMDTCGVLAMFIACMFFLRKWIARRGYYHSLPSHEQKADDQKKLSLSSHPTSIIARKAFLLCICYGLQMLMSSAFWNSYMHRYNMILENPDATPEQREQRLHVVQSSSFLAIAWAWRTLNANSTLEFILLAIFVDKLYEFLAIVQFTGFVVYGVLVAATEFHIGQAQQVIYG